MTRALVIGPPRRTTPRSSAPSHWTEQLKSGRWSTILPSVSWPAGNQPYAPARGSNRVAGFGAPGPWPGGSERNKADNRGMGDRGRRAPAASNLTSSSGLPDEPAHAQHVGCEAATDWRSRLHNWLAPIAGKGGKPPRARCDARTWRPPPRHRVRAPSGAPMRCSSDAALGSRGLKVSDAPVARKRRRMKGGGGGGCGSARAAADARGRLC